MVYWLSYYIFKIFMKIFFFGKCYDQENLPEKGPYVGVINHNSLLDIPAMSLVVNHRASTMVKHSLFKVPVLGWWLRKVNMFPVVRGAGDQEAIQRALNLLKQGHIVYMAPEGTRKYDPQNPPRPRTGFVRLAQLADCPVVPIALVGTREALPPGAKFPRLFKRVRAKVGKPIKLEKVKVNLENREKLQKQAEMVMREVYKLRDELLAMNGKK
ncbi:MAG: 1-acyl-sn-glycerol-3-phosphate acyltransferase [Calditrichaeota bacterium]|nr:MAG: 1-acyl-sn-glycerol-3-phosphate acyltransferase [Calditrichota bacterium]